MEREYKRGQHVIYVDEFGKPHDAIVNRWWKDMSCYQGATKEPGCNLVFVTSDEQKTDSYGDQIERATSVVHKSNQPAHGRYWCRPDEI